MTKRTIDELPEGVTVNIKEGNHYLLVMWAEGNPCQPTVICTAPPAEADHALYHVRHELQKDMERGDTIGEPVGRA